MAFPQVQDGDTQEGSEASDVTDHTLTYPTNLANGDLVRAIFACDQPFGGASWPVAFTAIFGKDSSNNAGALSVAYLVSDGTETGNFTVTTGNAQKSVSRVERITGWHGTTPPEITASGNETEGESISPDPPSFTPSWGAEDTLWHAIAIAGSGDSFSDHFTAAPANYTNLSNQFDGGGTGVSLGTARRELNAASEDPGAFTYDGPAGAEPWMAVTMAVRPAAAGLTPAVISHQHEGSDDQNIVIKVDSVDPDADHHDLLRGPPGGPYETIAEDLILQDGDVLTDGPGGVTGP